MSWQDIGLTIGQIVFIFSLLPSILSKNKPALATSLITATVLFAFTIIDITLNLYFTAVAVFATAIGWSILAYQKYIIDRETKE